MKIVEYRWYSKFFQTSLMQTKITNNVQSLLGTNHISIHMSLSQTLCNHEQLNEGKRTKHLIVAPNGSSFNAGILPYSSFQITNHTCCTNARFWFHTREDSGNKLLWPFKAWRPLKAYTYLNQTCSLNPNFCLCLGDLLVDTIPDTKKIRTICKMYAII